MRVILLSVLSLLPWASASILPTAVDHGCALWKTYQEEEIQDFSLMRSSRTRDIEPTLRRKSLRQDSETGTVNPITTPVRSGVRQVVVSSFAQIPEYEGSGSKIVGMTPLGLDLYVCTSTSGGLIYKVDQNGNVSLFFDVANAMLQSTGRSLSVSDAVHGGVRSLAFHPSFSDSGLFYVSVMEARPEDESAVRYLSKPTEGSRADADSVVIEWRYDFNTGSVDTSSYRQVLRIGMPILDHPIKQMIFLDDNLVIGHGDGSVQSATAGGGQANDALGKIIRINPLQSGNEPYSIPAGNPYAGSEEYMDEIYAVGFRNPHNLCYSNVRNLLFVTDAGRDNVEEVNIVKPGGNYGWSSREGPFVHLEEGGTGTGVTELPDDDESFGFTYPSAVVGHTAALGSKFTGQALAGSCPIENGSSLDGIMLYANFPTTGELYYSYITSMERATVTGPPNDLEQATTYRAKLFFNHDGNTGTDPVEVENVRAIVQLDSGNPNLNRVDLRFGQGPSGEIYISSKQNGKIYLVSTTVP